MAADEEWAAVQSGTLDAVFTTMVNNKSVFGPISGLFNEYAGSPNPDAWAAWFQHGDGLKYMQELAETWVRQWSLLGSRIPGRR